MHQNDETPADGERDESGPADVDPAEPDTTAADGPAADDDPEDELDSFAAGDVAHWARLMPDTSRWATIGVSANLIKTIGVNTRAFDQITRNLRLFDQIGAGTRLLNAAGGLQGFGLIESQAAAISKMVSASVWKPPPTLVVPAAVTAWSRSASLHQALDKLAVTAAAPSWATAFGGPSWIGASAGAWRIPGWKMPAAFDLSPVARSVFAVSALPSFAFRSDLFDILRGIRERLAEVDEFASSLFFAALDTRDAILTDPDARPVVRRFARTWLKIRTVTQYVLDAVVDVLLADDWHELDLTDDELREHLRARTKDRHEVHRPIFERQLNHHRIGSLSAPVKTTDGVLALDEAVAGIHHTEDEALSLHWADPRIGPLLNKLNPQQRRVVDTIAHSGLGWQEAAAVAGVTTQQAEATRRRLKYLAAEQNRRHADGIIATRR